MKIFTIELIDGVFVKEPREIEQDDLAAVLSSYYLHIPVAREKKKFYKDVDESECDDVVADLNNRLADTENITGNEFAIVNCKDCGNPFLVTAQTAEFYKNKGLAIPIRCKECRIKKKERFEKIKARG